MLRSVLLLLLINCILLVKGNAQNLIPNNGFEKHGQPDCLSCQIWPQKFASLIPPWKIVSGSAIYICDCLNKEEKGLAVDYGICPFDKIKPYAGNTMMGMNYVPSCYGHDFKTRGCSSYLGTRFDTPLEIGKIYEVSFWLYISASKDSSYAQQIGFNLYPDAFLNPQGQLLGNTAFLIDTVLYERWYPVKWLVRPTCNLQFLLLGVFRGPEGPPVNGNGYISRFYIDEVVVRNVPAVAADSNRYITPYCRYTEQEKVAMLPEIAGVDCLFASNDSSLSAVAMAALDAFAVRAKQNPTATFTISGHTDAVGSNYQPLSMARVKSVVAYLEKKHQIPAFRFFQFYRGAADSTASNQTEAGRQANRRVEIRHSSTGLDEVLYRNLLLAIFDNDKEQAFKLLAIWLRVAKDQKKMYLLFDPRLKLLQVDRRWEPAVVKKVKTVYETYKKPRLAFSLDSLGKEDQKCRTLKYYVSNLNAYSATVDSMDKRFDVDYFPDTADYLCDQRNEAHFQCLKKLLGPNNWPRISEVGERAAKTAFLVVTHSSDTSRLAQYLPLLKQRCIEGEAEWLHYAMLYDRLQVERGLPQRFGTQYRPSKDPDTKPERFPLQNPGKTNQWREELGLELLDDL